MGEAGEPMDIDGAVKAAEALVEIFKALAKLPDEESRARVMAMAATKYGFYDHAAAFLRVAKTERDKA